MSYKSIDGLMRHLRNNHILISGSSEKLQLRNTGYYHGYKGYRFFQTSFKRIPFTSYKEINATIEYDNQLKSLFYPEVMFIETAVKNVALNVIMNDAGSEEIPVIFDKVIASYNNCPAESSQIEREKYQKAKLKLQGQIDRTITYAYTSNDPKVTHFYNTPGNNTIPLWALLEIMMMGEFGTFISCLIPAVRKDISAELGISAHFDTNAELVYKYIFTIKDLRNAIAHNSVIFDARFRRVDPSKAMKKTLEDTFNLPYINFKTIGDYVVLILYYMQILHVSKKKQRSFLSSFLKITEKYKASVSASVVSIVIHPELAWRLDVLNKSI